MAEKLLTLKEASEQLNVHWQTVRNYIKEGKLKSSKIGRNIRIKQSDLNELIDKDKKKRLKEIELRYLVKNPEGIEDKLLRKGAKIVFYANMIDTYLMPEHMRSIEDNAKYYDSGKGTGFRIRETIDGYTGTRRCDMETKRLSNPPHHDSCIEASMQIDNYEDAESLLNLAGFRRILRIDKERTIFEYKGAKICLDKVKDYKNVLEIEIVTDQSREKTIKEIEKIAKELDIDTSKIFETSLVRVAMEEIGEF
jgi:predicted adenylyl cyclase CyaB